MDTHECIKTRRSMRKYLPDPVPEDKLARVLEAIQWSPSWTNTQPWEVVVVDDPEVKARLQEAVPEGNPSRKAVTAAPVLLVMCGRKGKSGFYDGKPSTMHGDWAMFDLGIACQDACLAAWAEGLGTVHLGLLDHARAGAAIGLPEGVEVYEILPLGLPGKVGNPPPRREIAEFTHKNRYGGK